MPTTTYTTVNGQILYENRGGTKTYFVPDTLGSVLNCTDENGNQTYKATYWPYGEIRTQQGTNPSPWGFMGTLGHAADSVGRIYWQPEYFRPTIAMRQAIGWPTGTGSSGPPGQVTSIP